MPRTFPTGVTVPTAGDRHPSEKWWETTGATTDAAIRQGDATTAANAKAQVDALRADTVAKKDAAKYGIPGPASSLSVGTVEAGDTPSASIDGDAPNQTLSLVLPRGPQGPEGPGGAFQLVETADPGMFTTSQQTIQDVAEQTLTVTGATSGAVYVSRYGPLVTLQVDGLVVPVGQASYTTLTGIVPTGFKPIRAVDFLAAPRVSTEFKGTGRVDASGGVTLYSYGASQPVRGVWTWRTKDAFPVI